MLPLLYLTLKLVALASTEDRPLVETSLGKIQGIYKESYGGRIVAAFEGIPFAKPPVGDLRFKEPQPVESWTGTLVTNRTYVCMQYSYIFPSKQAKGREDCLYLYVYVPRKQIIKDEGLDVIVHIHGGAFLVGDPKSYSGPNYIMDRDLIYVSMNYRLGILGFLSTQDEIVPGNNALKDQRLAMKWVQDHIHNFGGNPNSVTLTGGSAGGASVHFHYFSPLSKGLFHRGISHSGTAFNPWSLTKNPLKNAKKLAGIFNCNLESSEMVKCLRKVPGKNITVATSEFFNYRNVLPPNVFAPVVEPDIPGAFLPDHPYKLLTENKFHDVPWITSVAKDEGILPIGFFVLFKKMSELENQWDWLMPYALSYYDTVDEDDKLLISQKAREYYLGNHSVTMDSVFDIMKLHTDRLFLVDAEKVARLQAKYGSSPVYFYFYEYYINITVLFKAGLTVVAHGDDFRILYHQSNNPKVLNKNDEKMKDVLVDLLYSYATRGFRPFEWLPVPTTGDQLNYLHLVSSENISVKTTKEIGAVAFWNSLPFNENERLFN